MARGVNKVILVGTCGQDPEVKYLSNGNAVTNLSMATSEQWKDKQSGEKKEKNRMASSCYFRKGSRNCWRVSAQRFAGLYRGQAANP